MGEAELINISYEKEDSLQFVKKHKLIDIYYYKVSGVFCSFIYNNFLKKDVALVNTSIELITNDIDLYILKSKNKNAI